jgi:prevent-host-death family protein
MTTVNIHEAKTHLSRLLERAAKGETIVIAKAGKPMARLTPLETREETAKRRIGFMEGQIKVPDDFDTMFADDIERMFYGEDD